MQVRPETPADAAAVHAINLAALGEGEARLVDALRIQADPLVSLVAEADGEILGHILFSPATLDGHPELRLMGLAPMAVVASRQRQGVGSALVREGLARCRRLGAQAVIVLGHPAYYPRFGFVPASRFGVACEYDAPDEAFMLVELGAGAMAGAGGTARYHSAFAAL